MTLKDRVLSFVAPRRNGDEPDLPESIFLTSSREGVLRGGDKEYADFGFDEPGLEVTAARYPFAVAGIELLAEELARLLAPAFTQALLRAVESKVADQRMLDAFQAVVKAASPQPTGRT